MTDIIDAKQRSRLMSRVRSRNTEPEMMVRRTVHRLGYRYRLHARDIPGTPDLIFGQRRKLIFVHGCFWHSHNCKRGTRPTGNAAFWNAKLDRNIERDAFVIASVEKIGWSVLTVWECETKDTEVLKSKLDRFLRTNDGRP